MAKTFTLPDVQVGSILEYYYTTDLSENFHLRFTLDSQQRTLHQTRKVLSQALHQRLHAHWRPLDLEQAACWSHATAEAPNHVVNLEASDIPAFQTEDYMPPENEMKSRVDFIYSEDAFEKDPDKYWKKAGQEAQRSAGEFYRQT